MEGLRNSLAWRRARKLVRKRVPVEWESPPSSRRLLVVLPASPEEARSAWRFLERLNLDPEKTLPVVPVGDITYAPVDFLGRVRALNDADRDWTRIPGKAFRREVWGFRPEVAMSLCREFDLSSALLVGASPAAFRVGIGSQDADLFFDLVVSGDDTAGAIKALEDALSRIRPAIITAGNEDDRHARRRAW